MPTRPASLRATWVSEIEAQQGLRPNRSLDGQPKTHGTNKQINELSQGLPEPTGSGHPKEPAEVILGSLAHKMCRDPSLKVVMLRTLPAQYRIN